MSVGEIYRTLGNYPKAREFLSRAMALIGPDDETDTFGQVGLPAVRARSHLAWTLAELGDFETARRAGVGGTAGGGCVASRVQPVPRMPRDLAAFACGSASSSRRSRSSLRGLTLSEQVPLLRPPIAADLGIALARCGRIAEGLSQRRRRGRGRNDRWAG